jgi:uncharacterized protein YjbI with pentapeptide repeats
MAKAATKTIDFAIRNRRSGEIQFTAKIEADDTTPTGVKVGLAVRWAISSEANLSEANLSGANLSEASLYRANLSGANLSGANLYRADLYRANLYEASLSEADLSEADLSGANLSGASLSEADLSEADLSGANLSGANLSGANLSGANLSEANLSGANLSGANLSEADLSEANLYREHLRPFKADLWATILGLRAIPLEMRHLIAKLRAGKVDSHSYGRPGIECACLVGTLAQPRGVGGEELDHDASRPAERWFLMIKPGDVPGRTGEDGKETGGGFAARMALEWTLELAAILGIDPEAPTEMLTEDAA